MSFESTMAIAQVWRLLNPHGGAISMTLENRANVLMQFHFGPSRLDPTLYQTMERLLTRMIRQAKEDEREACAQTCEALGLEMAADAIRDMPVP